MTEHAVRTHLTWTMGGFALLFGLLVLAIHLGWVQVMWVAFGGCVVWAARSVAWVTVGLVNGRARRR